MSPEMSNLQEEDFYPDKNRRHDNGGQEKRTNRTPLYLATAFLAGILLAIFLIPSKTQLTGNKQLEKFNEIMRYVNMYYVDTVNNDKLFEVAVNNMLQSLDPHSTYINAVENKAIQESLDGAFEGIGVQFNIMNDTVMVVAVVSGGPSEKVGIRAGDRIVNVDGKNFAGVGIENNEVLKTLRGPKNSKVNVGVMREGFKQVYDYEITRDVIPTYTVDIAYMMNDYTGYVKINQFGSTTADEFSRALVKLKQQGMTKLILDLRGNPGGYLEAAIRICDELLANGEMIVYTEGLHVRPEKIYATRYGHFETGEVVVLIDDFSASASEIVAGAVQDNDRGVIIGRRSFGKGLVQRQFELEDKSIVRITVSRYHTPSGRSIQKKYDEGSQAYAEELLLRYQNGEMDSASHIKFDESLKYMTKNGRSVYGGGGIMPDYFVPLDRDSNLTAFYQVLNSSALIEFAFEYSSRNQDILRKNYPDAERFVKNMTVSDQMLQQLILYYHKKSSQKPIQLNNSSRMELKLWLKAIIGRNLYQEEAFYPVINTSDKVIMKALEVNPSQIPGVE